MTQFQRESWLALTLSSEFSQIFGKKSCKITFGSYVKISGFAEFQLCSLLTQKWLVLSSL